MFNILFLLLSIQSLIISNSQGGTKGFIGATEEAQAADGGLGNIALNTV